MFVQNELQGNYLDRPWAAYTDVQSALERGYREGLLSGRPEILEDAIRFANDLINYFKESEDHDYINKFGEARMTELVSDLRKSIQDVFLMVLVDNSSPLVDRLTIYNRAPADQQRIVYDLAFPLLDAEFKASPLSQRIEFESVFPEPAGMEEYRAQMLERDQKLEEDRDRHAGGAERQ